jgi:hypothetical protein
VPSLGVTLVVIMTVKLRQIASMANPEPRKAHRA